ncbi:MAG: CobW family GTP-binding protein [Bacillota bacterium]
MSEIIAVYLITGFLGSGKTTFLNRLIHQFPKDRKLMILMNEFGEIGVDGALVAGEDLDILEISKGSIFCACVKTDFIKGLFEISKKIRPDVLLIESTGVANPTDLKKDLGLPIFEGRFQLKEQFCIVDAASFLDEFGVFASVENQISSSTRFIINKIDLASPETIEEIKSIIKQHHPDPYFYETTFADIDVAGLLSPGQAPAPGAAEAAGRPMAGEDLDLDQYIDDLFSDPQFSVRPPDMLMSATFLWQGDDLSAIEEFTARLPGEVVRAKGFLSAGGRTCLYSYVMGRFSIEDQAILIEENKKNIIVFILPPRTVPLLERVTKEYNLVKLGELAPWLSLKE